jgi:hypothetical protein
MTASLTRSGQRKRFGRRCRVGTPQSVMLRSRQPASCSDDNGPPRGSGAARSTTEFGEGGCGWLGGAGRGGVRGFRLRRAVARLSSCRPCRVSRASRAAPQPRPRVRPTSAGGRIAVAVPYAEGTRMWLRAACGPGTRPAFDRTRKVCTRVSAPGGQRPAVARPSRARRPTCAAQRVAAA